MLREDEVRDDTFQPIEDARLQHGQGLVEGLSQGLMVLGLGVPVGRGTFPFLHGQGRDVLSEEAHVAGPQVAEQALPGEEQSLVRRIQVVERR